jgi:hypothetical protein
MPLPADFHDEDKQYAVRVCILVKDDPIVGFISGSIVSTCDKCGEAIWVDESQAVPTVGPTGKPIDGEVRLCVPCTRDQADQEDEGVSPMNDLSAAAMKLLGIKTKGIDPEVPDTV